jgi:hypothetical protein
MAHLIIMTISIYSTIDNINIVLFRRYLIRTIEKGKNRCEIMRLPYPNDRNACSLPEKKNERRKTI